MRLDPKKRTEELLDVALKLAEKHGYPSLTRESIASEAQVSPALVTARLGTMDALRRSVMRQAIRRRCLRVVAEGLVARDKHALKADESLRLAAVEWVGRV